MTEHDLSTYDESSSDERHGGVSRRDVMRGLGVVAGATAGLALSGRSLAAGTSGVAPAAIPKPALLATPNAALTYVNIDAVAFNTYDNSRYVDSLSGVGALSPPDRLAAPLMLEVGSVVKQLNVAYQGQPILEIFKCDFNDPRPWLTPFQQTLPAGGGAKTVTIDLTEPITIEPGCSYSVQFYTSPGSTLYGLTVGYTPAAARYIPFAGATPRVYDSRTSGGAFAANAERVIDLGFPGAKAALLNITVTETTGLGFIAAFASDVAYPGNSTVNWSSTNLSTANGAVVAMSPDGKVKLRCGGAGTTHVIVDRLGWFI